MRGGFKGCHHRRGELHLQRQMSGFECRQDVVANSVESRAVARPVIARRRRLQVRQHLLALLLDARASAGGAFAVATAAEEVPPAEKAAEKAEGK